MWARFSIIVLIVFSVSVASAETVKRVRFTDSAGNNYYVATMEEVPQIYKNTAATVMVRVKSSAPQKAPARTESPPSSSAKPEKAQTGSLSLEDIKNAVTVTRPLQLISLKSDTAVFRGQLKNNLNEPLRDVKIVMNITGPKGKKLPPVTATVNGSEGKGTMKGAETVDVEITTDIPPRNVKGFTYQMSWSVEQAGAAPAKQ